MNTKLIALGALVAGLSVSAKDIKITDWRLSEPITVRTPFMNDSIAPDGSKFKSSDLLKSRTRALVAGNSVAADTAGLITLAPAPAANGSMQLLQTQIRSERFAKGQLKITSQLPFIVELDGKEIASKLSAERDSVVDASTASASLRLEPERDARLTVKLLAMADDSVAAPTLSVTFVPDEKFENTVLVSGPELLRRFTLEDSEYGSRVSGL